MAASIPSPPALETAATSSGVDGARSRWPRPSSRFWRVSVKPRSRGSLRLRSVDPVEPPQIDTAVLADAADMARMVEAVRLARRLTTTPPLAEFVDTELLPGRARNR